jgi:N-acetylglucosamine-6-sulfatase
LSIRTMTANYTPAAQQTPCRRFAWLAVVDFNRLKLKAGSRAKRIRVPLGSLLLVATVWCLSPIATGARASAASAAERPNLVVIQADDQTVAQFNRTVMPRTTRLLVRPGTRFDDYIAPTPQCCPSRAALLTGQYAHNNGVFSNARGYPALTEKENVLPVWLQQAGYNTIHVGKFLNGYWRFADHPADVAPGWTDWRTVPGGRFGYYEYFISRNGQWHHFGRHKRDYITRVLTRNAVHAVDRYAPSDAPFYLQLDEHAPHGSGGRQKGRCSGPGTRAAKPDPLDVNAFIHAPLPHPPSFNERRMGDKPEFLRHTPRLDPETQQEARERWGCALASLVALDRSVADVYHAVKQAGELRRTVFIYTSDNGLFFGEHRFPGGKVLPYEEALRLPMVMDVPKRYRGEEHVRATGEPVANIDLAPTMLDLAHASPCPPAGACRTMDGRSLMPLITGSGPWPDDRALLTEYRASSPGHYATCVYDGVRTRTSIYVEHHSVVADRDTRECVRTLEVERYDLAHDPYELRNLCYGGEFGNCPADPEQANLEQRLEQLSRCAGIAGRDEQVGNRPFCE